MIFIRRSLLYLLTAAAMVFAVGWVRSYWAADFIGREGLSASLSDPQLTSVGISSGRGGIGYVRARDQFPPGVDLPVILKGAALERDGRLHWRVRQEGPWYPISGSSAKPWDRLGFRYVRLESTAPPPWAMDGSQLRHRSCTALVVPYWFLVVVFGTWPALISGCYLRRQIRETRCVARGLCVRCGYDLEEPPRAVPNVAPPPDDGG